MFDYFIIKGKKVQKKNKRRVEIARGESEYVAS